VDTGRFDPSKNEEKAEEIRGHHGIREEPVVLCVSRLVRRKGQDRLIEAMPELHRRFGARLLLVGEGDIEDNLRRQARDLGVENSVVFCGKVADELLPAYYAAADVFAMPSRDRWFGMEKEGFGVVYAEAAASGLPAVVGESGGAREAVEYGETGFVVDGSDRTQVREALGRLLEDEDRRKKMGTAARERAVGLHSPEVAGERYRRALEEVAQQNPSGEV
jgi:phosphatidylinositol alpha-1,6-mannosyltransferase